MNTYADIDLRQGDLETKIDETLEIRLKIPRYLSDDEMSLEADTINELLLLHCLGHGVDGVRLRTNGFEIIVVLEAIC
jgi:hypothetical protein